MPKWKEMLWLPGVTKHLCKCCSLSWFNEWPGFLSTKKGHRKKFASAVLPTLQVEITRRSNSAFIRCRSLWLGFPTLFNQESFTELTFTLTTSLVNSDSCRYKLDLHKSTAFVRQLSGRSLVINLLKKIIPDRFNTVLSFKEALINWTAFVFCLLCWLHTTLHCIQINSFELGNSTRNRLAGNHFLLSRHSRIRSCFFCAKK